MKALRILSLPALTVLALLAFLPAAAAQTYYFQGATSTDPTVSSNYYNNSGPSYANGSVTDYTQYISQAPYSGHDLVFSSALTTSNLGYLYAGTYVSGNVTVTGSTVNFGHAGSGGTQNVLGISGVAGTMTVSGGTVNFLAGDAGDGTSLWIADTDSGTFNLNGGTVTTQYGLDLSRAGGACILNVAGGLFNVQGTTGTIAKNSSAGGSAVINFLSGNGIFRESATATFPTTVTVNFSYQTYGQVQLTSATNPFAALAAAGSLYYQTTQGGAFVQLNNTSASPNYYLNYLRVNAAGNLQSLTVAPPANRILDLVSSPASGAYSLRLLRKTYTGAAIQVRRSSDNTTQDIGFDTSGKLATSTLLTFAGSGSCYVSIWYDQSGSGRDAANTAAAAQPLIVNAGNLILFNGLPAVQFSHNPTQSQLSATSNLITAAQSSISIVSQLASNSSSFNTYLGTVSGNSFGWVYTNLVFAENNAAEIAPQTPTTSPTVITSLRNGVTASCFLNGDVITDSSNDLDTGAAALNTLGGFSSEGLAGTLPELICFNTVLSGTDQNTLQLDQGNYYGIQVANILAVTPAHATTSVGNGAVLLEWSVGKNATSYKVEYKATASSTWLTYGTVATPQHGLTLTGLTNGTSYDFRVSSVNSINTSAPSGVTSATPAAAGTFVTAWNQTLSTGQSLSTGYNGGPPLTTTQPYSNLMLTSDNSALIPLVEPATGASGSVESMSSALANNLTNLAASASPNFLSIVSMHGVPGVPYSTLMKGTTAYANGQAEMNAAFNLANASSKSFSVDGVTVIHGESDESNGVSASAYEGYLVQWQSDYQGDAQAVTGQTGTLTLFTDQMSSWTDYGHATPTTAIGQWLAGRDNPGKIDLVLPLYIMDYADGVHLKDYCYRRMGEYFGKVMKQVLVDKKTWTPLSPKSVTRTGKVITAQFYVPVPPIAFDTTAVDLTANDGFEYYDAGNSATISSVAITASDTVQITLSNVPTTGTGELRYAFTGTSGAGAGAHASGAAKGNLRDSDATQAYYQDSNVPTALGIYLRNWLVTFDQAITVVNTVPGAPTGLTASASSTQAALSWTAPSDNGGSAITDYLLEYKPSISSTWSTYAHAASTATSATVTNLTQGMGYDFRVSAINAVGVSLPSNVASTATAANAAAFSSPQQIALSGGTCRISATQSLSGFSYQLQRSYTLASGSWTNVGAPVSGGNALSFSDAPDVQQTRVFYRLMVQSQ